AGSSLPAFNALRWMRENTGAVTWLSAKYME
ncbi:MAG: hypothetical protein ACI875_002681, partial [Planctomycetota bacterium]